MLIIIINSALCPSRLEMTHRDHTLSLPRVHSYYSCRYCLDIMYPYYCAEYSIWLTKMLNNYIDHCYFLN